MTRVALVLGVLGTALAVLTQCAGWDRSISEVRTDCPPVESNVYFFPPGALAWPGSQNADLNRSYHAKFLARMEEPSLSCGPTAADVSYRFTLLETFGPAIAIRIERIGDQTQLHAVELSGPSGYVVGNVARRQSVRVSDADWNRINETVNGAQFWQAPSIIERIGADGAQWLIEGRQAQSYHVVDRWSPEADDTIRGVGILFVELAGWSDLLRPLR